MVNDTKELKKKIGSLKFPIQTKKEYAQKIGIPLRTMQSWLEEDTIKLTISKIPAEQASTYLPTSTSHGRKSEANKDTVE